MSPRHFILASSASISRAARSCIASGCMALALLPVSCVRSASTGAAQEVMALMTDTLYAPQYAERFTITASPDSSARMISTRSPWQGAGDLTTSLLLLPAGAQAPRGDKNVKALTGEARRIVCMSSTHVAMLDALGAADRIVGVSGLGYISTPGLAARKNPPADVGYDGNIDYEALAGARPDLVLLSAATGRSEMEGKLDELGIPYMYVSDYTESSPLGKAEWMVALGEVIGTPGRGRAYIDSIAPLYYKWKMMAKDAAPAKVLLNAPYADSWMLPPDESYMVRLLKDAGAVPVKSNPADAARPIDMEEAYRLAMEADVWLNPGQATDLASLRSMAPRLAAVPLMKDGRVFNNNRLAIPGGGNPYFERGVIQPDVVLADLLTILHPELNTGHEPVYYMRLK